MTTPSGSTPPPRPPIPPPPSWGPPPPSWAGPPVGPTPIRPRARGPIVLLVVAPILFVLGVVATVSGLLLAVDGVVDQFGNVFDLDDELLGQTDVPGETTVTLAQGRYQVIALGPDLVDAAGAGDVGAASDAEAREFDPPAVAVTGPDGAVTVGAASFDLRISTPDGDAVAIGEFEADVAGTYTVTVTGEPGAVERIGIGEGIDVGELVRRASGGGILFVLGVLALVGSFGIGIAGVIWLVVDSSRR